MFAKSFVALSIPCLVFAQPPDGEQVKKELDSLKGIWVIQALEVNGRDLPEKDLADRVLTIQTTEYRVGIPSQKKMIVFRFVIDPAQTPKHIDMVQTLGDGTELVYRGIYVVENDTLTICRCLVAGEERPEQFDTSPHSGHFMVTWKRKPK